MKSNRRIVIWGAGGHASVVADAFQAAGGALHGFISADHAVGASVSGFSVGIIAVDPQFRVSLAEEHGLPPEHIQIALGIGNNQNRLAIASIVADSALVNVQHPAAVVSPLAEYGPGSVVLAGAIVNARVRIGRASIVNTGAIIEHDCEVGDGVHCAPRSVLLGGARVGPLCLIGAGAVVLPNVVIGLGATIGAGAVVRENVPAHTIVVGVPARPLQ